MVPSFVVGSRAARQKRGVERPHPTIRSLTARIGRNFDILVQPATSLDLGAEALLR